MMMVFDTKTRDYRWSGSSFLGVTKAEVILGAEDLHEAMPPSPIMDTSALDLLGRQMGLERSYLILSIFRLFILNKR
jgi:hypothetical protein